MHSEMKYTTIIKRLASELKNYKLLFILTVIMAAISAVASLITPILIGNFLDSIPTITADEITRPIVMLLTVYILGALSQYGMMFCANRMALLSAFTLRKRVYTKMEHLPISFFDTHTHGDIVSRIINDIDFISDGLVQGLSTMVNGFFLIIGSIIAMATIHIGMCLLVVACAPFIFYVARFVTLHIRKYFSEQSRLIGQMNGFAQEMIEESDTIKLFEYENQAEANYKDLNEDLRVSGTKATFYGALPNPSTRLVTNGSYILVGIVASMLAMSGSFGVGSISTFLLFSGLFARPINDLTSVITNLQVAASSSERVFQILDAEEERKEYMPKPLPEIKGSFDFDHVYFSYDKKRDIIKDFDQKIPASSRVAIVGKTGSGKTTLVNLLMRFYDVDKGTISLDGTDIADISKYDLRTKFGMVLQETYFFEESMYYNLGYGLETMDKERIEQACIETGVDGFIQKLPEGYETILSDAISLSEGQKQLLAITRVYIMNPSMCILDEATSSIDTRSELLVQKTLAEMMKDKTSFVIAHRLSTIIHSDIIIMMEDGRIAEVGTHEELLEKKEKYHDLYMSQFHLEEEESL